MVNKNVREAILASLLILFLVSLCGCEDSSSSDRKVPLDEGTVVRCKEYKVTTPHCVGECTLKKCLLDDGTVCYFYGDGFSCMRPEATPTG